MDRTFTDFTCGMRSACLSNKYRRHAGSAYVRQLRARGSRTHTVHWRGSYVVAIRF